jgi:hypothetical protein
LVDGHSSALPQVDSIVADVRLEVCDASYIAFVMKKGRGQIARSAKDHKPLQKTKGAAPGLKLIHSENLEYRELTKAA